MMEHELTDAVIAEITKFDKEMSLGELAAKYGVSARTMSRWKKKYITDGKPAPNGKKPPRQRVIRNEKKEYVPDQAYLDTLEKFKNDVLNKMYIDDICDKYKISKKTAYRWRIVLINKYPGLVLNFKSKPKSTMQGRRAKIVVEEVSSYKKPVKCDDNFMHCIYGNPRAVINGECNKCDYVLKTNKMRRSPHNACTDYVEGIPVKLDPFMNVGTAVIKVK